MIRNFDKSRTDAVVPSFVAATLAAMLPSIAVLALFFIKNILYRIYVLMAITFVFALALKYLASAKSMDVFAITAA